MKSVPLGSQNTVEFTASLPFSQHSPLCKTGAPGQMFDEFAILCYDTVGTSVCEKDRIAMQEGK